jgi:hypothetical protein
MPDRRRDERSKVLFGGVAAVNKAGSTMDCVVRNISDQGACIEFGSVAKLPDDIRLAITRKGRAYLARMIWQRANKVGLAFRTLTGLDAPVSDLDERLRKSQQKKQQLQRRINELLGEG